MAIIINKEINTDLLGPVNNLYSRVYAEQHHNGSEIGIMTPCFASKAAYKAGARVIHNILGPFTIPYNRLTDGTDVLMLAHNAVRQQLIEQGIATESEITTELD